MLKATMLDVGQGEAIILDFPSGAFALIDAGPSAAAGRVVGEVKARTDAGRSFLFAAATQLDTDHIGGMPAVLASSPPEEFVHAALDLALLEEIAAKHEGTEARKAATAVQNLLVKLKIDIKPMFAKQRYPLPSDPAVELSVLSPYTGVRNDMVKLAREGATQQGWKRMGNRASLALWLGVAGRALFFPGELEDDQYDDLFVVFGKREARKSPRDDPRATWVKLSHHGSDANNPVSLFQRFCAAEFVGSASAGGRYGHPHPTVLKRLHFECGGTAMCTRLGQGCHAILEDGTRSPSDPAAWLDAARISARANPGAGCFGDVVVTVADNGAVRVSGSSPVQTACPYGGPAGGQRVFSGRPARRRAPRMARPTP